MTVRPGSAANRTLRFEPSSSWTPADSQDGYDELVGLIFRTPGEMHLAGSIVTGVPGVEAGVVYYLGRDGRLATSPPISGFVVVLGKGIARGMLLFDPQLPVEQSFFRAMQGNYDLAEGGIR